MNSQERPESPRSEVIWALSLVAVVATVVFAIFARDWARSDRADAAQWIMAGASIATLVAAIGAGAFAAGAYRIEVAREKRHEDAEKRAQADRVAAWGTANGPFGSGDIVTFRWRVWVRNASPLPIYDVQFDLRTVIEFQGKRLGIGHGTQNAHLLPPTDEEKEIHEVEVSFNSKRKLGIQMEVFLNVTFQRRLEIRMSFRDTSNQWWLRDEDGILHGPFDKRPE